MREELNGYEVVLFENGLPLLLTERCEVIGYNSEKGCAEFKEETQEVLFIDELIELYR